MSLAEDEYLFSVPLLVFPVLFGLILLCLPFLFLLRPGGAAVIRA